MDGLRLEAVNIRTVNTATAQALTDFHNTIGAEFRPDAPPTPVEEFLERWHSIPPNMHTQTWTFWDEGRVVACGDASYELEGENTHVCYGEISVAASYRRRGLGTRLLRLVLEEAQRGARRVMFTKTDERIPAGGLFAQAFGGEAGRVMQVSRLMFEDLDESLMRRWMDEAPTERFELGFWKVYPEDELEQVAELFTIMNTAPTDDLEINALQYTAEQLRLWQAENEAAGIDQLVAWVRERSSGRYVGFSRLYWMPSNPLALGQADTGVHPDFRGLELGKWLKAANLEAMRARHPQAVRVGTNNATTNAPMLHINEAMGFKPQVSITEWQFDVAATLERLR